MNTRKILSILLIMLVAAAVCPLSAKTTKEVVSDTESKLRQAPSVTASFSFKGTDISGTGSITLAGSRFRMNVGNVKYWYNGKTLWTYFVNNKEVYISEPTADELAEINPVSVLNSVTKECSYTALKAPKGSYKIKCTARKQSVPFSSMTVTVSSSTYLPSLIEMATRNSGNVTLTISSISIGKSVSASTFTFSSKDAPGAEIVDMR